MQRSFSSILILLLVLAVPLAAGGEEPVDWDMVNRIREEGLHRSEVMETAKHLTDTIGPRLTGSPGMKEANEWTRQKMEEWGLQNAHLEAYGPFGRGWSFSRTSVHMTKPRQVPLIALPAAWAPGTDGVVRGQAVKLKIESKKDMETWRGKLQGKILFVDDARDLRDADEPAFQRRTEEDLAEMLEFEIREPRRRGGPDFRERMRKRYEIRDELHEFLVEEGVVALVEISSRDGGMVRLGGAGSRKTGENPGVPVLVMAAEQYNWIQRLLPDPPSPRGKGRRGGEDDAPGPGDHEGGGEGDDHGEGHDEAAADEEDGEEAAEEEEVWEMPVELEIEVAARFHDDDEMAYNTVAEIPGSEADAGVVMLGAHLDSWHPGTGATDNAAGCVVVMEAVRILQAIGAKPRRAIRVGLWSGEEQGLLGSRAYVEEHFATLPYVGGEDTKDLPRFLRKLEGEVEVKPGHETFGGYFNLDNGSGRIRGIYAQENAAVARIFKAWLEPFHDLGADTVTSRNTRGTDHLSFNAVGLPGFQFIQDRLDYSTRTHHTNMDVYDHLVREDLIQASIVMASFVYHAAMREEPLPRKPMPRYEPQEE